MLYNMQRHISVAAFHDYTWNYLYEKQIAENVMVKKKQQELL